MPGQDKMFKGWLSEVTFSFSSGLLYAASNQKYLNTDDV